MNGKVKKSISKFIFGRIKKNNICEMKIIKRIKKD